MPTIYMNKTIWKSELTLDLDMNVSPLRMAGWPPVRPLHSTLANAPGGNPTGHRNLPNRGWMPMGL